MKRTRSIGERGNFKQIVVFSVSEAGRILRLNEQSVFYMPGSLESLVSPFSRLSGHFCKEA